MIPEIENTTGCSGQNDAFSKVNESELKCRSAWADFGRRRRHDWIGQVSRFGLDYDGLDCWNGGVLDGIMWIIPTD